jgi:DNA-directed RNA polymerase subunit beta'
VQSEQHNIPFGWEALVEDGDTVKAGQAMAEEPEGEGKIVSGMSGEIYLEGHTVFVRTEVEDVRDYEIPQSARLFEDVVDGMQVKAGQQLTEGAKNPHRILRILGQDAAQHYLLTEVQKVYRNQGVNIADKHFEVMIRKMLNKVQITRSGDSELLPGELIDKLLLIEMNERLIAEGNEPASAIPILLGVTKAALTTDSFLSASSFQHTIKVLAGAAIEGKVDRLFGLKENVIIGKLIPAGTGFHTYQDREIAVNKDDLEEKFVLKGASDEDEDDEIDDEDDLLDEVPELGQPELDDEEEEEFADEEEEEEIDDEDLEEEIDDDVEEFADDDEEMSLEMVAEDEDDFESDDEYDDD